MKCIKCEKSLDDGMKFCPYCGNPVDAGFSDNEEDDEENPRRSQRRSVTDDIGHTRSKDTYVPFRKMDSDEMFMEQDDDTEPARSRNSSASSQKASARKTEEDSSEDELDDEALDAGLERRGYRTDSSKRKKEDKSDRSYREEGKHSRSSGKKRWEEEDDPDDDDDDWDEYDKDDRRRSRKNDDEQEDWRVRKYADYNGSRAGLIAFIVIFVIVVAAGAVALTSYGQRFLAKHNLTWKSEVYAELGKEAYDTADYVLAENYYRQAVQREPKNYEYTHSTMVASYMADDLETATEMALKCVEMNPNDAEPYVELRNIYMEMEIPYEVREVILKGYVITGEPVLNIE